MGNENKGMGTGNGSENVILVGKVSFVSYNIIINTRRVIFM